MTLWSGRVQQEVAPEIWRFLKADDAALLPYDIEGTRIHANRLHGAGILDDDELAETEACLAAITPDDLLLADEDVHSDADPDCPGD